jgi:uncharacterized membrane protein (UPF0127 family)
MIEPNRGRRWALALCAVWAFTAASVLAQEGPPEPLSAFPQSLLAIRTASAKVVNFKIWTADTPRRDAQGLMFVREMDDHAGMLFLFPGDRRVSMWMKNTYIPLDMLFVAPNGRINTIVARTTPLSLDVISAADPARAVLELKGGVAEEMGIKAGDMLVHPSFGNTGSLGRR